MAKVSIALLAVLNGLLITGAIPQYGPQGGAGGAGAYSGGSAAAPPPPPPPPPAAAPSYGGAAAGGAPAPAAGGAGGELTVQCKATPDAGGKFKYDCSGVNKDAITLKTEHILWLENQGSSSQNLDVEIPNYNIDEFIKAAFKASGAQDGAKINILLKKPELTYNAAKEDAPKAEVGAPSVSVNYQPVEKVSVHYPTQKQYSNGGGSGASAGGAGSAAAGGSYGGGAPAAPAPAPAAAAGGSYGAASASAGAYSRPQRESGYRYYFIRQ